MSNKIFTALINEQINIFKNSFCETSTFLFYDEKLKQLIHPGEYGMYRENDVKNFLKYFIPERLNVDDGFIITADDFISTQCDIIIYDKSSTPLINGQNNQKFFTQETVVAIGEVKSNLNKCNLGKALNKLARNKKLRRMSKSIIYKCNSNNDVTNNLNPYNHLSSFLICNKLDFNIENIIHDIDNLYDSDIDYQDRHNMILSLNDGIILYSDGYKNLSFPKFKCNHNTTFHPILVNDENNHIKLFAHFLYMITSSSTVYYPDLILYMDI